MEYKKNSKRPRVEDAKVEFKRMEKNNQRIVPLTTLLEQMRWEEAMNRAISDPEEVAASLNPSPLAVACRVGAPYECVRAILEAAPEKLRCVLDSRGTPLHEAIVCETTSTQVIDALLQADEALGNDTVRATLLQDVDGFTPLHVLIRRRFQSHILSSDEDMSLMEILEMLVRSCPEAVVIPDLGEYEEPPIVYALKANIYAPSLGSEDETLARVERQIYEMVRTMLKYAPSAAARVFSGFRGQYSALHSAVFHGRYTTTIELLLQTEAQYSAAQNSALLTNTQSELPLHFCAMRGERPGTVRLLASSAPDSVARRDATGLTPFHWLWIRFVSRLLAMEEDRRDVMFSISTTFPLSYETNHYNDFTAIESGDFDRDLPLIRRLDPPVDFLRMRHIPVEVSERSGGLEWAQRTSTVLKRIREQRFKTTLIGTENRVWTRQEAVVSLFWTKVVSLLQVFNRTDADGPIGNSVLVHASFACPCCPPPVAYLVASLFPKELVERDGRGRLPIHYAACRPWHTWDWPREDGMTESTAAALLRGETLSTIHAALQISPPYTVRVADGDNCLVLHHIIRSFVRANSSPASSMALCITEDMLELLRVLIRCYPLSLGRRDGVTMLYPFLQATALAAEAHLHNEALPISITFELLRENPSILADCTR